MDVSCECEPNIIFGAGRAFTDSEEDTLKRVFEKVQTGQRASSSDYSY